MDVASVIPDKLKKLFGVSTDSSDAGMMPGLDDTSPLAQTRQMDAAAPEGNAILAALKKSGQPFNGNMSTEDIQNLERNNPSVRAATFSTPVPPKLAAAAKGNSQIAENREALPLPLNDPNPAAPSMSVPNNPADVAGIASSKPTAEQLPSLAPQGSSHAIPQALLELMGIAGPQPKPGETYTGPMTLADKIKGGIGFAGKLGNAVAAASGTPEQKELAEKRAEFGPELQAKKDIAQAQIKSLGDYRVGQLSNADNANTIKQQQADIAQQKADQANQIAVGKMALQGQVPLEGHPGVFRDMTTDEILTHPILSKNMDLKDSAMMVKNAQAALAQTRADVLAHPEQYATFQQKERQIQATLKMAQSHLNNALANTRIRAQEAMWQFGTNPLTGEQENAGNAPQAGIIDGQVTPMKSPAFPTTAMRNIQGQANTVTEGIPGVIQQVTRLKDKMGPISGRWNDFMQGKVGADDPEFASLKTNLMLTASAVAIMHARGRLPENLRQEFDHMINAPQQTPENIISVLSSIQPWAERAAHTHVPRSGDSAPTGSPAAPANKVPSFADWQAAQKKTQGGH